MLKNYNNSKAVNQHQNLLQIFLQFFYQAIIKYLQQGRSLQYLESSSLVWKDIFDEVIDVTHRYAHQINVYCIT